MTTGPLILERIPVLAAVDLVVVGGGSAGCCAALAARAEGVKWVLVVERYGFLGGTSTQMLDTFYGFITPGEQPKKVVGRIPDRVVNAAAISLRDRCGARTVPVAELQSRLRAAGARLETPEAVAQTGREAWRTNRA